MLVTETLTISASKIMASFTKYPLDVSFKSWGNDIFPHQKFHIVTVPHDLSTSS